MTNKIMRSSKIKNFSVHMKVNTFSLPGLLLLSELKYLGSL